MGKLDELILSALVSLRQTDYSLRSNRIIHKLSLTNEAFSIVFE